MFLQNDFHFLLLLRFATPCRFTSTGCDVLMRKIKLEEHESKCRHKPVRCPMLNCPEPVHKNLIKDHMQLHGSKYYAATPLVKRGYLFHWNLKKEFLASNEEQFNEYSTCYSVKELGKALFIFRLCVNQGFVNAWVFFYNTTEEELDKYYCTLVNLDNGNNFNGYFLPLIPIETPSMDVIKNRLCRKIPQDCFERYFTPEGLVLIANRMMIKGLDEWKNRCEWVTEVIPDLDCLN